MLIEVNSIQKIIYLKEQQNEQIKGDMRPKLHPCFYGIYFLILWREKLSWKKFFGENFVEV